MSMLTTMAGQDGMDQQNDLNLERDQLVINSEGK